MMRFVLDNSRLTEDHKTMGLELAGVGLTVVDYIADTVVPDQVAADIFGLEPNVAISRAEFHQRIHPDDQSMVLAEVDKLMDPTYEDAIEITHRTIDAGGQVRWVHARKRLYREPGSPSAKAVSGVAAILDITPRKKAEQAADFLLRELQHRTTNAITVISSIARMVYDAGEPKTFWQRFEPRIVALANNSRIDGAANHRDLRATLEAALSPFLDDLHDNVSITGPDVNISEQDAQSFAIIFHELATNSMKHGALGELGAAVEISWDYQPDKTFALRWFETRPKPINRPKRRGFGTQMLEDYASISLGADALQSSDEFTYAYDLRRSV